MINGKNTTNQICDELKHKYKADTVGIEIYSKNNKIITDYNVEGINYDIDESTKQVIYAGNNIEDKYWYYIKQQLDSKYMGCLQSRLPSYAYIKQLLKTNNVDTEYINNILNTIVSISKFTDISALEIKDNQNILIDIDIYIKDLKKLIDPKEKLYKHTISIYEDMFPQNINGICITEQALIDKTGILIPKGIRIPFIRYIHPNSLMLYKQLLQIYDYGNLNQIINNIQYIDNNHFDHFKLTQTKINSSITIKLYLRF